VRVGAARLLLMCVGLLFHSFLCVTSVFSFIEYLSGFRIIPIGFNSNCANFGVSVLLNIEIFLDYFPL
jgi:hypothetical protein